MTSSCRSVCVCLCVLCMYRHPEANLYVTQPPTAHLPTTHLLPGWHTACHCSPLHHPPAARHWDLLHYCYVPTTPGCTCTLMPGCISHSHHWTFCFTFLFTTQYSSTSPYRDAASAAKCGHVAEVVVWGSGRHGPHRWVRFTQLVLFVDAGDTPGLSGQTLWEGRGVSWGAGQMAHTLSLLMNIWDFLNVIDGEATWLIAWFTWEEMDESEKDTAQ